MEGREQVSCVAFQARDPSLSHTCQFFLHFICIIFMHVIHLAAFKNKKKLRKLPKYLGFHGDASLFSTKHTCFWHYVSYWNTLLKRSCSLIQKNQNILVCSHEHKKNRWPQEYQQIQGCFFCVTASLLQTKRLCVNFTAVFLAMLYSNLADEFKHLLTSPGVNRVTLLPGPDAGEGTVPESHSAGAPPAPLPKALGTPFLYRSPHETLPPSLTCWLKPQPSPPLKTFT